MTLNLQTFIFNVSQKYFVHDVFIAKLLFLFGSVYNIYHDSTVGFAETFHDTVLS